MHSPVYIKEELSDGLDDDICKYEVPDDSYEYSEVSMISKDPLTIISHNSKNTPIFSWTWELTLILLQEIKKHRNRTIKKVTIWRDISMKLEFQKILPLQASKRWGYLKGNFDKYIRGGRNGRKPIYYYEVLNIIDRRSCEVSANTDVTISAKWFVPKQDVCFDEKVQTGLNKTPGRDLQGTHLAKGRQQKIGQVRKSLREPEKNGTTSTSRLNCPSVTSEEEIDIKFEEIDEFIEEETSDEVKCSAFPNTRWQSSTELQSNCDIHEMHLQQKDCLSTKSQSFSWSLEQTKKLLLEIKANYKKLDSKDKKVKKKSIYQSIARKLPMNLTYRQVQKKWQYLSYSFWQYERNKLHYREPHFYMELCDILLNNNGIGSTNNIKGETIDEERNACNNEGSNLTPVSWTYELTKRLLKEMKIYLQKNKNKEVLYIDMFSKISVCMSEEKGLSITQVRKKWYALKGAFMKAKYSPKEEFIFYEEMEDIINMLEATDNAGPIFIWNRKMTLQLLTEIKKNYVRFFDNGIKKKYLFADIAFSLKEDNINSLKVRKRWTYLQNIYYQKRNSSNDQKDLIENNEFFAEIENILESPWSREEQLYLNSGNHDGFNKKVDGAGVADLSYLHWREKTILLLLEQVNKHFHLLHNDKCSKAVLWLKIARSTHKQITPGATEKKWLELMLNYFNFFYTKTDDMETPKYYNEIREILGQTVNEPTTKKDRPNNTGNEGYSWSEERTLELLEEIYKCFLKIIRAGVRQRIIWQNIATKIDKHLKKKTVKEKWENLMHLYQEHLSEAKHDKTLQPPYFFQAVKKILDIHHIRNELSSSEEEFESGEFSHLLSIVSSNLENSGKKCYPGKPR